MGILSWTAEHWFSLVQTLGIIVSFVIAARSLSIDARARTAEIHLSLTAAHRDIWENLVTTPHLAEVLSPTRNLTVSPPIAVEERFVMLVLAHTAAVHKATSLGVFASWEGLEADIREFFLLPVPSNILTRYLPYQESTFQKFISQLLHSEPHKPTHRAPSATHPPMHS